MCHSPRDGRIRKDNTGSGELLPTITVRLLLTRHFQQMTSCLYTTSIPPYVVNLDPACIEVPYPVNIDIRDTVKYKEVMKQYGLGPNGGIITSLNLFSTRFDQVLQLLDQKKKKHKYVIFDTPGQIEVFTWSASGTIITETLASTHPTVVIYVMDISKCQNPITFMSNMLYACSILYKTKLPFLIAFNKVDIVSCDFANEWMRDLDAFDQKLETQTSYLANFTRSLSLVLDKFYENIRTVGVSAGTGEGIEQLLDRIDEAKKEYLTNYKPQLEKIRKSAEKKKERRPEDLMSGDREKQALDCDEEQENEEEEERSKLLLQ